MKYATGSKKEDDNDENGPKRRILRHLGHLVGFFYIISCII